MVDQSVVDHYEEMDIDEMELELEDIYRAIECEKYRANHAYSDAEITMHLYNIQKLKEEAAYVRKLIKELMAG